MAYEEEQQALADAYDKANAALTGVGAYIPVPAVDTSVIAETSRSYWVWIFDAFARDERMPVAPFGSEEWTDYLSRNSGPPIFLLIVGAFLCLFLLFSLCCTRVKADGVRPSLYPLKCTSCVGFILLWICVAACVGRGMYCFDLVFESVSELQPDIDMVAAKVDRLQPQFHNTNIWMQGWQLSCIGWKNIEPMLSNKILDTNQKLIHKISNVSFTLYGVRNTLAGIPEKVAELHDSVQYIYENYRAPIGVACFIPTILATLVIGVILHAVLFEGQSPRAARIANFFVLNLGAVPIILIIAALTVVCAGVLFGGTVLGSFCAHPEENTINMVASVRFEHGGRENNYTKLVSYYLTGQPEANIVLEPLIDVENAVGMLSGNMWIIGPALDLLGLWCKRIGAAMIPPLLNTVVPDIESILPLASRAHIYGHYDDIVVRGVCGQMVAAMGWYLVCTLFAGMILLPVIAWESHRYLSEMVAEGKLAREKAAALGVEESKSLLSTKVASSEPPPQNCNQNIFKCCGRSTRPVVLPN